MKKVLILSVAVMMIFAITVTAHASEVSWRFTIRADNNAGALISDAQFGMFSTSSDGYDGQDRFATFLPDPSGFTVAAWCTGVVPGRTEAFMVDIKDDLAGAAQTYKSWDLRVFALKDATYSNIRLQFLAANPSTAVLPPASINGVNLTAPPAQYRLTMINNRGVAGAPANGTQWLIPVPTVASISVPFFTLIMPTGYNTASDIIPTANNEFASVGYEMKYELGVVPEPTSMLALGSGLTGLLGFIIRRRRG